MKKLFRKLFDIREGEAPVAALMFFMGFLIIASLSVLKPVRDSLFLVRFGNGKLPIVFVLVAVFSALVAVVYAKYSKKISLKKIIQITFLIAIGSLLAFWFLLYSGYESAWFLYAFYIWVEIFGVISGTQFWLLANEIYNAREAKRLFGLIGAGAISGGILGGYLTSYLAPRLTTENLIFFCVGFLILCQIFVWSVWKKTEHITYTQKSARQKQVSQAQAQANPVKLIFSSRHLAYLAGIIGVGVIVACLADYQFLTIASRAKPEADSLTAFFGLWWSNLNILSLVIQLFLTGRIIKHLGVTASLLFLPCALMVGAVAIFISPVLWSAILIKMGDGGFKHSINKAGTELLAIPIPAEIKTRTKSFIDVFIKNAGQGLGGVLLIALTIGLRLSVRHVSLIAIALIVVWAFLILRMKDEYVNSFRMAIEKRSINLEDQSLNLDDAAVIKSFTKVLSGKSERQILYVLNMLEDVKNKELAPYLERLIHFPSNAVISAVLKMACEYKDLDLSREAQNLLNSDDLVVQAQAMRYICKISDRPESTLQGFLKQDNPKIQLAALLSAAQEWKENRDFRRDVDFKSLLENIFDELQKKASNDNERGFIKMNIAEAIGHAKNPDLYSLLHNFINDESTDVKKAAVISMGRVSNKEFIPVLIDHINSKYLRKEVRESLTVFGEDIIPPLAEILENPDEERLRRMAIPKVMAMISSQKSVNTLMRNTNVMDLPLRYETIKALNKLRIKFPKLKFDPQLIRSRVFDEISLYKSTLRAWLKQSELFMADQRIKDKKGLSEQDKKARLLLIFALEEKLDKNLERVFRLLGMKYSPKDMVDAYLGLMSRTSKLKAIAIEFLDNILETRLKKLLIPIVETGRVELISERKSQQAKGVKSDELASIQSLLSSYDNWLKACTIYLVATLDYREFFDAIRELTHSGDPIVSETAQLYLRRLSSHSNLTTGGKV